MNSERQNSQTPFPILVRIQMREARYAFENGGKTALAETLKRFSSVVNAEMILADAVARPSLLSRSLTGLRLSAVASTGVGQ